MSTYGPSRAKPKPTSESRYNPLTTNKSLDNPMHRIETNQTNDDNNNTDSDSSSHSFNLMHKKRITPSKPINNNNNEGNKWNFGVGLIKSVWSNVMKPVITSNNNTNSNNNNNNNIHEQHVTIIPQQLNEFEVDNTVKLLDNKALTERVREIVQIDNDNNKLLTKGKKTKSIHKKIESKDNNNFLQDLQNGNLITNNDQNEDSIREIHYQINESVIKDKKRERTPTQICNSNEPSRKRPKININYLPIGVVRSHNNYNRNQKPSEVTRALQYGVNIIRESNSETSTPILSQESMQSNDSTLNARKRPRNVLEENRILINTNEEKEKEIESEPPIKKMKLNKIKSPISTRILSQESQLTEIISTSDISEINNNNNSINKRDFRLHYRYEYDNNDQIPIVSVCCSVKMLQQKKERYLEVYKKRLEGIYSKYNMKNKKKINEWLNKYGGDIDKLHELYVQICNKYDLIACIKYDGQLENMPNENEIEISKLCTPKVIKGIEINISNPIFNEDSKASQELTIANVDKHTNNDNNSVDDDSRSDTTHSTFQTPRRKDMDQQSQKSDTLNTTNEEINPFFITTSTQSMSHISKKRRQYNIDDNQMKQNDNVTWNNLPENPPAKFDFGSFIGTVFTNNNNNQMDIINNHNNNNNIQQEPVSSNGPMLFPMPSDYDNWVNNDNNNNNDNNTFNGNNNNNNNNNINNNNQWNNCPFGENNNNNNNNQFTFGENNNNNQFGNNNANNNWNNNNNNNQYTFGDNNNNNNAGDISRSNSVDQSFFNQTPRNKNKRANRRFHK